MKKYTLFIFIFFLSTILVTSLFAYDDDYDESDDAGSPPIKVYPINNDVTLIPSVKIQYGKSRVVVKSVYPLLSSEEGDERVEAFNSLVTELIQDEVTAFQQQVADNKEMQKSLPKSVPIKNDLNIDFAASVLNTVSHPILSVRFNIQGYLAGMAHPYHHYRVINYDLDSSQQITLNELFKPSVNYLSFFSDYAKQILSKQLKSNNFFIEGTSPFPSHYQTWNLSPSGILITFEEAQVAPSVYGSQTILVPYSALSDLISPESLLAECLKHKKRCLRNNVLTGCFIDLDSN